MHTTKAWPWTLAWLLVISYQVHAAELSVFCAGAVKPALTLLGESFQRSTGNTLVVQYAPVGVLLKQLTDGARPDVLIVTADVIADAQRQGWAGIDAQPLGSVGVGVAIREGAPVPNISTPEDLKQAILAAPSITYIDPTKGTSGKHFAEVLSRLGIAEQVRAKTVLGETGYVVEPVARGEVAMGFQQITEILPVRGVVLVGPLPGSLQKVTTYVVAPGIATPHAELAQEFMFYLRSQASKSVFRSKGFESP